ncbi:hypothetical protein STEG23_035838, partial [Scotinomys teguina]
MATVTASVMPKSLFGLNSVIELGTSTGTGINLGTRATSALVKRLPSQHWDIQQVEFVRKKYSKVSPVLEPVLIETSCFWRIKHNEEDDGDLRNDCEFSLFLTPEPEEDFYNRILDF